MLTKPQRDDTFSSASTALVLAAHSALIDSIARSVQRTFGGWLTRADVEDLRQVGRIALDTARAHFDSARGVPFVAYAARVIRNDMISEVKRLGRRLAPEGLAGEIAVAEVAHWADSATPVSSQEREDVTRAVRAFVGELPARQAQVVRAIFEHDLTPAAAARSLNISRPRVSAILREVIAKGRVRLSALAA
jgi:RNA polymerase sigma factor (sigma-70 family)